MTAKPGIVHALKTAMQERREKSGFSFAPNSETMHSPLVDAKEADGNTAA
jgi:hypothetical protein